LRRLVALTSVFLVAGACSRGSTLATTRSSAPATTTRPTTASPSAAATTTTGAYDAQQAPEDCGGVSFSPTGLLFPVTCPDGRVNLEAIVWYRQQGSLTIDLDPRATAQQVQEAVCHDRAKANLTNPELLQLYNAAKALNGWPMMYDDIVIPDGVSPSCSP